MESSCLGGKFDEAVVISSDDNETIVLWKMRQQSGEAKTTPRHKYFSDNRVFGHSHADSRFPPYEVDYFVGKDHLLETPFEAFRLDILYKFRPSGSIDGNARLGKVNGREVIGKVAHARQTLCTREA